MTLRRLLKGTPRGATGQAALQEWRQRRETQRRAEADLRRMRVLLILTDSGEPIGSADIWSDARTRWGARALTSGDIYTALSSLEADGTVAANWHADGRRKYQRTMEGDPA